MESYMVEFHDKASKKVHDLMLPSFLTGNDLVRALNTAYQLNIDVQKPEQVYFRAENPTALITGQHTLEELGVRNGTSIIFER